MQLSRKDFLKGGLAAAAVAAGIGELGCSDDDEGTGGAAGTGTGGSRWRDRRRGRKRDRRRGRKRPRRRGGSGTGGAGGSGTGGAGGSGTGGASGSGTGGSSGSGTGGSSGSGTGGSSGRSGTGGSSGRSGTGGSSGRGTGGTGNSECDNPEAAFATNHVQPHEMTVSAADVAAGVEKMYDIQGESVHPHTVTLTAAHFTTLQGGGMVTVTSSRNNEHTHMVTVTCGKPRGRGL